MTPRLDSLRTTRLLMRRWCDGDRALFAALNADPEVMRHFPAPLDRVGSDALVDRIETGFEERGFGLWALEVIDTGDFIGFTGLSPMPQGVPGSGGFEVGWRLARHAWHQGYATEAAGRAVDVAFEQLHLPEVWSITALINERSQAVMGRLGMIRHSTFEHPKVAVGHPVRPHVAYHLDRGAAQKIDAPAGRCGPETDCRSGSTSNW